MAVTATNQMKEHIGGNHGGVWWFSENDPPVKPEISKNMYSKTTGATNTHTHFSPRKTKQGFYQRT